MIKYFSTFSGIGGFELGIGEKGECVGFSEIDKNAIKIYQKHFPNHEYYGDITTIDAITIPDFDILCGGFPCQAFSIAGKRGGFDDTRGTLFFDLARITRVKKPRLLFFENVKGLLSHDRGRTFDTIIRTLDELGYDCQWQVLNSDNLGTPQVRERIYIIGHLRGTARPQVFPLGKGIGETNEEQVSERFGTNIKPIFKVSDPESARRDIASSHSIRDLTPIEYERSQCFPDNWTEGISDRARYKACGNAVCVNVIKEIIKRLIP
jgi:DNA (cytosine-5)-methyltransferase 1